MLTWQLNEKDEMNVVHEIVAEVKKS